MTQALPLLRNITKATSPVPNHQAPNPNQPRQTWSDSAARCVRTADRPQVGGGEAPQHPRALWTRLAGLWLILTHRLVILETTQSARSRLHLALEFIEKAPVGVLGDELLWVGLDQTSFLH